MRSTIVNALMSTLTSTILVILAWRSAQLPSFDEHKCEGLMKTGRWSQKYTPETSNIHWQPYGCQLHLYDETSTSHCLSDRPIYFIGDSTVRQVFWAVAHKLGSEEAEAGRKSSPKHADLVYKHNNVTLRYRWDPYLNNTETLQLLTHPANGNKHFQFEPTTTTYNHTDEDNVMTIISTGLWYARYLEQEFAIEYEEMMKKITGNSPTTKLTYSTPRASTIMIPPPTLNHATLDYNRARTLTVARVSKLLRILESNDKSSSTEIAWATRAMTENNTDGMMSNGLHVTANLAGHQADVILNRVCNQKLFHNTNKASSMCCVKQKSWHLLASVFLSIMAASNIVCHFWIHIRVGHNVSCARIQSLLQFTTVVCYCWIADRTTLFEKSNKIVQEDIFKCAIAIAAVLGVLCITIPPHSSESKISLSSVNRCLFQADVRVLARSQTEEWKGWMQVYILLYHYFGMSRVLWAYRVARVLVASYIFLTAYSHATYFQKTKDFSSRRVVNILLRLNILPCTLAAVMNNEYDSYYFPELASLWFLLTFAIFWTKYDGDLPTKTLIIRIVVAVGMLQTFLTLENPLSKILSISRTFCGPRINTKEFFFRVRLDAHIPFFGMLASIIQHRYARWNCNIDHLCCVLKRSKSFHSTMILAASFSLLWVYLQIAWLCPDKFAYNKFHPIISILPIAAYVMARNAYQGMRRCSLSVFTSIGTYSLELFVLQYHIWLATDTRGLLRLGLLDRSTTSSDRSVISSCNFWLETLVITLTFFWLSSRCADATNTIVQWVIGEGKGSPSRGLCWPLPDSVSDKTSDDLEEGRCCQHRGVNISIIILGILWLVNIIYS